jgi:hypothetical protein
MDQSPTIPDRRGSFSASGNKPVLLRPLSCHLPKVWLGFVFAGVYWIVRYWATAKSYWATRSAGTPEESLALFQTESLALFLVLILAVAWGYWLFCVYRIHKTLWSVTNGNYTPGPAKAVGLMLIPCFNVYWAFRWTGSIADFVNSRSPNANMAKYWPGVALAAGYLLTLLDPGLDIFILFVVTYYLTRKLRHAVRSSERGHVGRKTARLNVAMKTEPLTVAIWAGAGAAYGFLIAHGLLKLIQLRWQDHKLMEEGATLVLVYLGLALFVEPLLGRVRSRWARVPEPAGIELQRKSISKVALWGLSLAAIFLHTLLDGEVNDQLEIVGPMVFFGIISFGTISYFWFIAGQCVPRHAARSGVLHGATFSPAILLLAGASGLPSLSVAAIDHWIKQIPGLDILRNILFLRLLAFNRPNSDWKSLGREIALMAFTAPILGLAGGLAIDRTRNSRIARNLFMVLVFTGFFVAVLALQEEWIKVTGAWEALFFIAGWCGAMAGWVAGLFVCPSAQKMLIGAGDTATEPQHPAIAA